MKNEQINGARILLECLSRVGVTDMFGYPGGSVIPIFDEIYKFDKITHYFARHEQGAAHEADGYARATGKVGCCLATSGPGATNLVTGIMTAHMDSVPLLCLTGQVPTTMLGRDSFQESDIVGITIPITKMNYLVTDIRDLPRIVQEAYYLANTGRKGPVLIDIPKDVQLAKISVDEFEKIYNKGFTLEGYDPTVKGHSGQIKRALTLLKDCKKPLIIAGAGVLRANATDDLKTFASLLHAPITTTLLGLGAYPCSNDNHLGMLGMHGTVAANYATEEADCVIACGIRFDDRITGNPDKFCKNAKVIHIDIDPAEISKNIKADVPIVGDLKNILEGLNAEMQQMNHQEWIDQCASWKKEYPMVVPETTDDSLNPQYVLSELNKVINGDAIIVTDVGQHQMWTSQFMSFEKPNTILSSGGAGTMGFGIPASIGAQIGMPDKKVVLIVGDGGFQMTLQELMMLRQYNLPVKVFVMNNSYLGMVRQWQEIFNDRRYSFVDLSFNPDFNVIAEAYGLENEKITTKDELKQKLQGIIECNEPMIINCIVEKEANVLPMIPAGATVGQMMGKRGVLNDE